VAICLVGCEPIRTGDTVPGDRANSAPATAPSADNTAVNERDASGATKTPIDQNETQGDVKITADIRKRILDTEGMSINGRNVKVVTAGGKVTLRGPVESAQERDTIDQIAREVAGNDNVTNELDVKGESPGTPSPSSSPAPPADSPK
jgi:hyperosmotically inducible periplasmic protein